MFVWLVGRQSLSGHLHSRIGLHLYLSNVARLNRHKICFVYVRFYLKVSLCDHLWVMSSRSVRAGLTVPGKSEGKTNDLLKESLVVSFEAFCWIKSIKSLKLTTDYCAATFFSLLHLVWTPCQRIAYQQNKGMRRTWLFHVENGCNTSTVGGPLVLSLLIMMS